MMLGVGVGVDHRINWTGVMATGLGGRLLGVRGVDNMVTLDDNAGGVSVGTLGNGAGQSVCSTPAGAGRGVFGAFSVGGFSVTLKKMRESVLMSEN